MGRRTMSADCIVPAAHFTREQPPGFAPNE
jgi:hypothetical protein